MLKVLAARAVLAARVVLVAVAAGRVLLVAPPVLEAQALLVPQPVLAVQEQRARQARGPRAWAVQAQVAPQVRARLADCSKAPFAQAAERILHAGGGEEARAT